MLRRSRAHIRRRTREMERTENRPEDNGADQSSETSKVSEPKVSENNHESGSVIGVRESDRVRKKRVDPDYVYYY